MIDINTYRLRIGSYSPGSSKNFKAAQIELLSDSKHFKRKFSSGGFYIRGGVGLSPSGVITCFETLEFRALENMDLTLGHLVYIYYILLLVLSISCILLSDQCEYFYSSDVLPSFLSNYYNFGLPSVAMVHVRLAYFVFLSYLLNNFVRGQSPLQSKDNKFTPANIFFGPSNNKVATGNCIDFNFNFAFNFPYDSHCKHQFA